MSWLSLPGFEPVRVVGRGSAGVVYLARDLTTGESVAIKHLHTEIDNEVARERFAREARIMQSLRHPSLVRVREVLVVEGSYFLVLEYVDGATLADVLPIIEPVVGVGVVGQLAAALDVVHDAGVVHRDVKPANVLLSRRGQCKLTDFGVARFVGDSIHVGGRNGIRTKTGTTLGSPAYMSPEVAAGHREIDRRADVYSLAVVAYRLAVGRLPFIGDPFRVLQAQIRDAPPTPSDLVPTIPPAVDDVLLRGLSKEPSGRYRTAGEFAAALTQTWPSSGADESMARDALVTLVATTVRARSTDARFNNEDESGSSTLAGPTIPILARLPKANVPIFRPRTRRRFRILALGVAVAIGGVIGVVVALVRR
jgi:eukaryotic-like serine/threonine-protein kinase